MEHKLKDIDFITTTLNTLKVVCKFPINERGLPSGDTRKRKKRLCKKIFKRQWIIYQPARDELMKRLKLSLDNSFIRNVNRTIGTPEVWTCYEA